MSQDTSSTVELMSEGVCTDKEGARFLGIGVWKTRQMMRQGHLPVVRIGRSVRIPRRALRLFLAERLTQANKS